MAAAVIAPILTYFTACLAHVAPFVPHVAAVAIALRLTQVALFFAGATWRTELAITEGLEEREEEDDLE